MFADLVKSTFSFLEHENGFRYKKLNERTAQYERDDVFISLVHTQFDEIAFRAGLLSRGFDKGFSAGVIVALTDPKKGFSLMDRMAFHSDQIEDALLEHKDTLRKYGGRILEGDVTVFDDLQGLVDSFWMKRGDSQIRQRAEAAFAAKDYEQAWQHYRSLGERKKPLDKKRMEMCERRRTRNL